MMKFISFISKNIKWICILSFIVAFCISRIPYFLIPIVGFGGDIPVYYEMTYQIYQGQAPVLELFPVGYSLFLYICEFITFNSSQILFIQNCISLLTYSFLILTIFKYYKAFVAPVTFAAIIIIFNCAHLDTDTNLMTESIYVNSLLTLISLTILCIKKPDQIVYWLLLSACFVLPMLIRTSGIIVLGLFGFLLIFLLINKFKRKTYFLVTSPFLLICILWSFYNFKTQNIFFIGYPKEILTELRIFFTNNRSMTDAEIKKENNDRANHPLSKYFGIPDSMDITTRNDSCNDMTVDYGFEKNHFRNFINFYKNINYKEFNWYSIVKRRYKVMYIGKWSQSFDTTWGFQDTSYAKFVFKEYMNPPPENIEKFRSLRTNMIFKLYDYTSYKFYQSLFRNYFWLFLNLIIYLISLFWFLKSNFKDREAFLLCFIILLNVLNSIIFLTAAVPLYRYSYTTEFTYYLIPALFFTITPFRNYFFSLFRKIF